MIWVDTSHTAHSGARTGVQKVVRAIATHLRNGLAVTHDPFARTWRPLAAWERDRLEGRVASHGRSARWPLTKRLSSWLSRFSPNRPELPRPNAILLPEIFGPAIGAEIQRLRLRTSGPVAAVFHDAIALKLPELSPPGTVARFPAYLRELAACDGIAAVSEDSRLALASFWTWAGLRDHPPITTVPLGIDLPPRPLGPPVETTPTLLCVGTIEGRKNHLALLDACERLWQQGEHFQVRLVGHTHRTTGAAAAARIASLSRRYPLEHYGTVTDEELEAAYEACTFTVYPSLMEGFGLPVLESLARGRPCICGKGGALLEAGRGGGCLQVNTPDADSLASAIVLLIRQPRVLQRLAAEAKARSVRTWTHYTDELSIFLDSLPRRGS